MKKIDKKQIVSTETGYKFVLKRNYRAVFGLGEKFDSANQKGKYVRACVREKCFYQGEYSYLSMPFFLTPDGFGVYVDTYVEVDFDFRKEGEIAVEFAAGSKGERAEIYLFEGNPKQILEEFRSLVGMPRLFPKWTLGAWMSSNRWHTQEEVEEQMRLTRENGFPHNVLVIEPWSDLTTRYLWRGSTIPHKAGNESATYSEMDFSASEHWQDPKKLISEMHSEGLHCLLWVVPIYAQGINLETNQNLEQCYSDNEYVKENRECVLNEDGTPYEIPRVWCIGSMVPDFTDPQTIRDWFAHFEYLKELGFDGFKTDGGEFIHEKSVRFHDGSTGIEGQNAYSEQYIRAFSEFVGKDRIVFSRAGGQRTPSYSVVWAGDQESTWSELGSVIKAGLSAGLSGIACWGYDIAGFSGYLPTKELYLRAVQAAAFLPVMQWHSDPVSNNRCDFTGAWTCNDRSPWNISAFHKDKALLNVLRDQFYLHYNLMPYEYALQLQASRTGLPAMRHLALEFPDDENVYSIDDEFMLGNALLIAPVLQDYISSRKVYLPKGNWFDLYTGEKIKGGETKEVSLAKEHLPVYFRENACIPLNLAGRKLCSDVGNDLEGYKELCFLVSGEGEYFFEDDLGNRISLVWNREGHTMTENQTNIEFAVLHIERDKIFG